VYVYWTVHIVHIKFLTLDIQYNYSTM